MALPPRQGHRHYRSRLHHRHCALVLRVCEIEEGERRCGGAGGSREGGRSRRRRRRRLDVSRPHVIPSYSTLSVRRTNFCCTENIRAPLLHDFAPVKNRYCPSSPRCRPAPHDFSDNFFELIALSGGPRRAPYVLDQPNDRIRYGNKFCHRL